MSRFDAPQYILPPGMRFPPTLPPVADSFELDAAGAPDWRATWRKELEGLQRATEEQEKAPEPDPEWFRLMLCRVRGLAPYPEVPPAREER